MYKNIANPRSLIKKEKRSIIAGIGVTLGLGIVDLLITGLSYKSLNSHISRVEHNLEKFMSTQHQFDEKILQIDENIVHIIDSLRSNVNQQLAIIDCKLAIETGRLFANQISFQWDHKLNSLFKSAITGQITSALTPDILTPDDLMKIMNDHSNLKSTYFSKNTYNLYRVGKLTLVGAFYNITDNTITVHHVLTIPMVSPASLFPYFKIEQTGVVKNNVCLFLDLPEYMYKYKNEFFPLDKNCHPGNAIITCFLPVLRESMHNTCLNNFTYCKPFQTPCKTTYSYDNSGILITTTETLTAYQFETNKKSINVIPKSDVQTKFLSWHNTVNVQIGKLFIEKPSLTASHLIQNFSRTNLNNWNRVLNLTFEKINAANTSNILQQINSLKQPNSETKSNTFLIYMLLFSLGSIAIGSIATLVYQKFPINFFRKYITKKNCPDNPEINNQLYPELDLEATNVIIHPQSN